LGTLWQQSESIELALEKKNIFWS